MTLAPIDIGIIIGYFIFTLAVGLFFSRRAGRSLTDYVLAGRSLPWWIAGTSMVATTFASDTPLAVTGLLVKNGLAGNWFWWAFAFGGMVTVFIYARLWRRAEVLTDLELIEIRYSGRPAGILRGFRAIYVTLVLGPIVVGWVTGAMVKVLKTTILSSGPMAETSDFTIILGLLVVTAAYSVLSGLWGVVVTDFLQFTLAMIGCTVLAVFAVHHVGGIEAMQAKILINYPEGGAQVFRFLPDFSSASPLMPLNIFFILLFFQWWASSYEDPSGNGQLVQRVAACKDERHGLLAVLWFRIAHYCVRPWPWLMVAFVAMAMFPGLKDLPDPGVGYPMVIRDIAPAGLLGLILVTFFAAYMSTISTHVNLQASYLVNDIYKRFLRKNASDRHYAWASRVASLLVLCIGAAAAYMMRTISIDKAWKILAAVGAGAGTVYMLRWFWWRINAWSEIAAMAASLVAFLVVRNRVATSEYQMLIIAGVTITAWVSATFLTPPEKDDILESFYRKVRPGGPGWKPVAARAPGVAVDRNLGVSILLVFVSSAIVYLTIPGIGCLIFGQYLKAALCLGGSAACACLTYWLMHKAGWQALTQ